MKTVAFKSILLTSILVVFLYSCSEDDGLANNDGLNQIENVVLNGTWRITSFIDSGKDETNDFAGYTFTFNDSGVLNANNGTNDYNGSWSITDSYSTDDSQDELDFNINFDLANDFEDLNDDWDLISNSSTKIELIDISGGNGGVDYLTFEKN